MHATASRPTAIEHYVVDRPPSNPRRRADIALLAAVVAPLAVLGLLVAVGVPLGIAVCVQLVLVFVVTTAMDIGWVVRRRRSRRGVRDRR